MGTVWPGITYPVAIDTFSPALVDNVDEVIANHPNSLATAVIAIENKLGITNDAASGFGGISFVGVSSNPGAGSTPTLWVDDSGGPGYLIKYTDELGSTITLGAGGGSETWAATSGEALTQYAAIRGTVTGGTSGRIYESDATNGNNRAYVIGFTQTVAVSTGISIDIRSVGLTQVVVDTAETWALGDALYMSKTMGEVTNDVSGHTTTGDVKQRVGYASAVKAGGTTIGYLFIAIGEPTIV